MLIRSVVIAFGLSIAALVFVVLERDLVWAKVPWDCVDPTERERVRDLVLAGVDDGLRKAMTHLFDVWQKDPNTEQPRRAQVGTTNAVNAHNRARKLALAWDPPPCPQAAK
jgi:hypothetical protein